jgi:hypothetical protein
MSWYFVLADGTPQGPLEFDEICRRAAAGEIAPDPMVIKEGDAEWRLLSNLRPMSGAWVPPVPPDAPRGQPATSSAPYAPSAPPAGFGRQLRDRMARASSASDKASDVAVRYRVVKLVVWALGLGTVMPFLTAKTLFGAQSYWLPSLAVPGVRFYFPALAIVATLLWSAYAATTRGAGWLKLVRTAMMISLATHVLALVILFLNSQRTNFLGMTSGSYPGPGMIATLVVTVMLFRLAGKPEPR